MADIPEWAIEKACTLARAEHPRAALYAPRCAKDNPGYAAINVLARYISEHEEPPVDPLLNTAIELVIADDVTRTDRQIAAIRERRAGHEKVNLALAALRRGMELAKEQSDAR